MLNESCSSCTGLTISQILSSHYFWQPIPRIHATLVVRTIPTTSASQPMGIIELVLHRWYGITRSCSLHLSHRLRRWRRYGDRGDGRDCGWNTRRATSASRPSPHYPVVIVGGGPSGLFLSNLLSRNYQVPNLVLEQQTVEKRFRHPQAHFMNTRTMELLRYCLPTLYDQLCDAMPPVEQWKSFRYVSSMSQQQQQDTLLAEVVHPVDRPLQAGRDANGLLRDDWNGGTTKPMSPTWDLSVCTVGHLAQHTFGRLLYDHAKEISSEFSELRYNAQVQRVYPTEEDTLVVETTGGAKFLADFLVAADGSDSTLRRQLGIGLHGTAAIQQLMNIHVRLPLDQAQKLHANSSYAMLYSIFSPDVLAMVVCHSVGEYIIQIPYFPPYETIEEDFGPERLHQILRAIFGSDVDGSWDLISARPWTMSSLVADRYYSNDGIALVGDAAHVFPPAGGFGMNTGLQDAHNLAWKIAWGYHTAKLSERSVRESILQSYHKERRPIAQQNAALSVRNYQRLLEVVKASYMDERHSVVTRGLLDVSPLPLSARRTIWRSLLKTVMYPFSWLSDSNSMYAQHIRQSIRRALRSGQGLPLLFPDFELNFSYIPSSSDVSRTNDWRKDSLASYPILAVGRLVPHVKMIVVSESGMYPNLQVVEVCPKGGKIISSSNLPAQLSLVGRPVVVLMCIGLSDINEMNAVKSRQHAISTKTGLPVQIVYISHEYQPSVVTEGLNLWEKTENGRFSFLDQAVLPCYVLIRPDGHIAAIQKGSLCDQNYAKDFCGSHDLLFFNDGSHR